MKNVIERLQKENESFKRSIKKQQRGLVEAENTRLKVSSATNFRHGVKYNAM